MTTMTTDTVYHRKDFKTKPAMKKEYKELVAFIEQQLKDEARKDQEIQELKEQNLKLIQRVDALDGGLEEAYREGGKDMLEDILNTKQGANMLDALPR